MTFPYVASTKPKFVVSRFSEMMNSCETTTPVGTENPTNPCGAVTLLEDVYPMNLCETEESEGAKCLRRSYRCKKCKEECLDRIGCHL